jgi:error-prone DNA polymerase
MSRAERVLADYRRVGLSVEGHPMEFLRPRLERKGVLRATELQETEAGRDVAVAGLVIVRQRPRTARGVVFVTLEDETGFANGVLTPDVHERFRRRLRAPLVVLCGEVEREAGVVNVRARRVVPVASDGRIEVSARSYR